MTHIDCERPDCDDVVFVWLDPRFCSHRCAQAARDRDRLAAAAEQRFRAAVTGPDRYRVVVLPPEPVAAPPSTTKRTGLLRTLLARVARRT